MKRLFAMLISFALVFTLLPVDALAMESKRSGYDSLVEKAAAVFPEYSGKLLNPSYQNAMYTHDPADRVLVVKETRPISDRESITYIEYSDGLILLSGYNFTYESTVVDSSTGSTERKYTIDIEAACVFESSPDGYFYLDGVSYILRDGYDNFDSITDPGTARLGDNCLEPSRTNYVADESYTGYARLEYRLGFRYGTGDGDFVTSDLFIHVGEDTAIVDHLGWN